MRRGKPVNVRPGRTTVVTLPSGEEVAFEPEHAKGHLLLRISAPEGSQIDHRKVEDEDSPKKRPAIPGETAVPTIGLLSPKLGGRRP